MRIRFVLLLLVFSPFSFSFSALALEKSSPGEFSNVTAMVLIKGGCFMMGSPENEPGRSDTEGPQHKVCVQDFYMGKTEVSFAQWDACEQAGQCFHAKDEGWGRGDRPVINVSWNDVQKYLEWLKQQTGKAYRLPSEAEWEYAARAGTTTAYSWGDAVGVNKANCHGCGSQWDNKTTAPVGSFPANGLGLYDMHGNVWEWCADGWHGNYEGAPGDGSVWAGDNSHRVDRGGAWISPPQTIRAARRYGGTPGDRYNFLGLRLVLDASAFHGNSQRAIFQ